MGIPCALAAAGKEHSVVATSAEHGGACYAFGSNRDGQLGVWRGLDGEKDDRDAEVQTTCEVGRTCGAPLLVEFYDDDDDDDDDEESDEEGVDPDADLDPDVGEIRPAAADDDDDVDDVDYGPEFTPRNELLLTPRYRADKKRKRPPSTSPAVISLSCGSRHTAVVVEDERTSRRAVYAWGWNAHGQCGTRDHLDVPYPVKIRRVLVHTGPRLSPAILSAQGPSVSIPTHLDAFQLRPTPFNSTPISSLVRTVDPQRARGGRDGQAAPARHGGERADGGAGRAVGPRRRGREEGGVPSEEGRAGEGGAGGEGGEAEGEPPSRGRGRGRGGGVGVGVGDDAGGAAQGAADVNVDAGGGGDDEEEADAGRRGGFGRREVATGEGVVRVVAHRRRARADDLTSTLERVREVHAVAAHRPLLAFAEPTALALSHPRLAAVQVLLVHARAVALPARLPPRALAHGAPGVRVVVPRARAVARVAAVEVDRGGPRGDALLVAETSRDRDDDDALAASDVEGSERRGSDARGRHSRRPRRARRRGRRRRGIDDDARATDARGGCRRRHDGDGRARRTSADSTELALERISGFWPFATRCI
eukprot:30944-Pelagococcus_subviridis.AAC.10